MFPDDVRPIPGFEGSYSVSRDGRVLSHKWGAPKWLRRFDNGHGYLTVALSMDGKPRRHPVHRLVALAWISNTDPATKVQVNHLNGIKSDCRAENLEWCTGSENVLHAFATGLRVHSDAVRQSASRMGLATRALTRDEVRAARASVALGATQAEVRAALGLSAGAMSNLVNRRTYRDIT